jgi:hypothetical protein
VSCLPGLAQPDGEEQETDRGHPSAAVPFRLCELAAPSGNRRPSVIEEQEGNGEADRGEDDEHEEASRRQVSGRERERLDGWSFA